MAKWNGLEIPKLPRGVYLEETDWNGIWIRVNAEERPNTYTNLVYVREHAGKWYADMWDEKNNKWNPSPPAESKQQALDYAVAMLWLGEVQYTLDEGRVDVRHED